MNEHYENKIFVNTLRIINMIENSCMWLNPYTKPDYVEKKECRIYNVINNLKI